MQIVKEQQAQAEEIYQSLAADDMRLYGRLPNTSIGIIFGFIAARKKALQQAQKQQQAQNKAKRWQK